MHSKNGYVSMTSTIEPIESIEPIEPFKMFVSVRGRRWANQKSGSHRTGSVLAKNSRVTQPVGLQLSLTLKMGNYGSDLLNHEIFSIAGRWFHRQPDMERTGLLNHEIFSIAGRWFHRQPDMERTLISTRPRDLKLNSDA